MSPIRLDYEDSVRRLQQDYLDDGDIPQVPDRMPAFDDEELGVSFFKETVGDADSDTDDLSNLTLPRTFIGRCLVANVSFSNNDFTESNFCWNDFEDVDFSYAILAKSDLRASTFTLVKFTGTDLRSVDFRHSTFVDCDFTDAILAAATVTKDQIAEMKLNDEQISTAKIVSAHGAAPGGG